MNALIRAAVRSSRLSARSYASAPSAANAMSAVSSVSPVALASASSSVWNSHSHLFSLFGSSAPSLFRSESPKRRFR